MPGVAPGVPGLDPDPGCLLVAVAVAVAVVVAVVVALVVR